MASKPSSLAIRSYVDTIGSAVPVRAFASNHVESSQDETAQARRWLSSFESVPESLYSISYSRSSGPGGQNVNKTNSKATLKVDLDRLDRFLPDLLHNPVRDSRYCARKSHALVISSDDSRSQADNRRSCQVKLYNEIVELAKKQVPGQTSTAQKQRVQNLAKAANQARLQSKKAHGHKKGARKGGGSGDY